MTLLMAACCAAGQTVLRGAAQEPEIGDMIAFLSACGADIQGAGTPVLTVQGGRPLGGAFHRPLPDRIAAATYAAALACAGGQIEIAGCDPASYDSFLRFLAGTGVQVSRPETACGWPVTPPCRCGAGRTCGPTPGPPLPPTLRRWAAAVLLTAAGESEIYDSLFANRFACAAGFAAMGAACTVRGRQLTLPGGAVLHGTDVTAPDLRGGAALLAAALAADGETRLRDPGHIPRGYEDLPGALRGLGAEIS